MRHVRENELKTVIRQLVVCRSVRQINRVTNILVNDIAVDAGFGCVGLRCRCWTWSTLHSCWPSWAPSYYLLLALLFFHLFIYDAIFIAATTITRLYIYIRFVIVKDVVFLSDIVLWNFCFSAMWTKRVTAVGRSGLRGEEERGNERGEARRRQHVEGVARCDSARAKATPTPPIVGASSSLETEPESADVEDCKGGMGNEGLG